MGARLRLRPTRTFGAIVIGCCLLIPLRLNAGDVTDGRAFAEANCAKCHALAKGGSSDHPDAPPFSEIAQRYRPADLAEALTEGIMVGHPDMPTFALTAPEAEDLVRFLESLRKQD